MERLRFKDDNGNQFPEWIKTRNKEVLKERKEFANKGIGFEHLSLTKEGVVEKSARYERDFLVRETNKNYKVTRIGDLCYNPANLKFGVITLNENKDGIFSPIYVTFEIKPRVSWLFAKYFYIRDQYIKKLLKFEEGTVYERKAVKPYDFLNHNISIPVIEEQEKIGNFLSLFDRLLEKINEKIDLLKELKKGYLQQMFPAKGEKVPWIRFSGFEDDWEQNKFNQVVLRVSTQSNSSHLPRVEYEDIIAGEGRLNKDVLQMMKNKKGLEFFKEDILYGKLRPYLKNWLLADFNGIAVGDFWILRPKNTYSKFIYNLIQTENFQDIANLSAGSKMPRSDWSIVSKKQFYIPNSRLEQEKIGNFLSSLDKQVENIKNYSKEVESLKKGYMQRLFA